MQTSHYLNLDMIPEYCRRFHLANWQEAGGRKMILPYAMLEHAVRDEKYFSSLMKDMERCNLRFYDAHVPWGEEWALNTCDPEKRKKMFDNFQCALSICASVGIKTVTAHVGDNFFRAGSEIKPPSIKERRNLLYNSLEKIIPEAEKYQVILCIENVFSPADSFDELLLCFQRFSSPCFGFCYDTGHANIRMPDPVKTPDMAADYIRELWRFDEWYYEDRDKFDELLEYTVTCHLHDNDGLGDWHMLPGKGKIDWDKVIKKLGHAKRLVSIQNECAYIYYGYSLRRVMNTFFRIEEKLDRERNTQ